MRRIDKMSYEEYLELLPAMLETRSDGSVAFSAEVRYDWFRRAYLDDGKTATIHTESEIATNHIICNVELFIDGEMVSSGSGASFIDQPIMTEQNYDRRDYAKRNAYISALDTALNQIGFSSNFLIAELKVHGAFKGGEVFPLASPEEPITEQVPIEQETPNTVEKDQGILPDNPTQEEKVPINPQSEEEENIKLRKAEEDLLNEVLSGKTFEVLPEKETKNSENSEKTEKNVDSARKEESHAAPLPSDPSEKDNERTSDDVPVEPDTEKTVQPNEADKAEKSADNKLPAPNASEKEKKKKTALDPEIAGYVFTEGYCYKGKSVKYIVEHNAAPQIATFCKWIIRCGKNEKDIEVCRKLLTYIESHAE